MQSLMKNKKLDKEILWSDGISVKCIAKFMPTSEGFENDVIARSGLFANFEIRGERISQAKDGGNQVVGLFIRGDKMFLRYWSEDGDYLNSEMVRIEFPHRISLNKWYRIGCVFKPTEKEGVWKFRFIVSTLSDKVFLVEPEKYIFGVKSIHSFAMGDERPNDNDGGVFYWEHPDIFI